MRIQTSKGWLEIRELRKMDEMVAAEKIQLAVWGANIIPHPKELLIPVQNEGGLLAGAFTVEGEMVGMLFGFPTRDPAVMHSQILATLPDWRGMGVGRQMKWYQRRWCLERRISLVRWTVDPLRAANALLNIHYLGGMSSTYYPDYYGVMQGIDAGAPTDRLLVEWRLESERVAGRAAQASLEDGFAGVEEAVVIEGGVPVQTRLGLDRPAILVRIPGDFIRLSASDSVLAMAWRMQTREVFLHYFSKGYAICEFSRTGGPDYLLEKTPLDGGCCE